MTLPVVILAGGLATRLRPLTATIPKALIEVAGEPFAHHQLRLLARNGVTRVVYCVGYLGELIVDAVGDGRRFGLDVRYVFDGEKLLGTGGAIAHALPVIGDRFLILYGDSYLDVDYQKVAAAFLASGQPALMTVYANAGRWDTSNVEYDGHEVIRYSKTARNERMRHIDYGLGAAHKSVFEALPCGIAIDLAAIYERLASEGKLAAFEVFHRFYEIGSSLGIQELEVKLLGQAKQ